MALSSASGARRPDGWNILIVALLCGILVQLAYLTNRRAEGGGGAGGGGGGGAAQASAGTRGRAMFASVAGAPAAASGGGGAVTVASLLARDQAFAKRVGAEFAAKSAALLKKNYEGDKDKIVVFDTDRGMYLWDWFIPLAPCAHKERVGTIGDGGKWVCDMARYEAMPASKPCVIYSFGVRDDSSFEAEMHERTHCDIFAFDMTVDGVAGAAAKLPRVTFWKMGLGAKPGEKNGMPITSLALIMEKYGHTFIDILKVDVEYSEVDIIPDIMKAFDEPPFEQLLLEVHHWNNDRKAVWSVFESLEAGGALPFMNENNHNPAVIGHGPLVAEYSYYNSKKWFDPDRAWNLHKLLGTTPAA